MWPCVPGWMDTGGEVMRPAHASELKAHLIRRLLQHHDHAVHLTLLRRHQRRPHTLQVHRPIGTKDLQPHPVPQLEQLLRARRKRRPTKRTTLRDAPRAQLHHARPAERVAARQPRRVDQRILEADHALVRLGRRFAEPVELRLGGGREDEGGAGALMSAKFPVLLVGWGLRVGRQRRRRQGRRHGRRARACVAQLNPLT